jgi:preprotein translocase subunit SecD
VAVIVCATIAALVIFALATGDINGFNNTYLG